MESVLVENIVKADGRSRINWPPIVAVVSILGGLVLRWIWLGVPSLWYDEGYTAWVVSHPARQIISIIQADTAPPLYYLLLRGWVNGFGHSEAALRSLAALISSISLVIFYPLARRILRDRAAAAIAVMLVAASYLQVEHAREARFYPLMILLAELALWLVVEAIEKPQRWQKAAMILVWVLALYTNNIMAFYLAGLALAWLMLPGARRLRDRMVDLSIVSAGAALLYLPWLPTAMAQARSVQGNFWVNVPTKEVLLHTIVMLAGANEQAMGTWDRRNTSIGIFFIAVAILMGLAKRETHKKAAALVAFGVLPVLVIYLYSHVRQSIFVDRSMIPSTIVLPLIVTLPLAWVGKIVGRWSLPVCAVLLLIPCLFSLQLNRFTRNFEDWREVCLEVEAHSTDRQLIVFVGNEGELLYDYYVRGGDYSPQPNLTGAPVGFLESSPSHTMQRVRSEKDLDGVKATLASGAYDQVVLVNCHPWWSDVDYLAQKYFDETLMPRGRSEFGLIVVRRWTTRRRPA